MSSMHPGMMMRSMRRDPSVVEQKLTRETLRRVAGFAAPLFFHALSLASTILRASARLMSPANAMSAWSGTKRVL